jgi:predicted nucleic-acid-binding protein
VRVALDTNVLVRLVTDDDPEQARTAEQHLEGNQLFLAKTVLLEAEWVLRYAYELPRSTIAGVFRKLLGLEGLDVEADADVRAALAGYEHGLDFADALHLASSRSCDHFATFDRTFAAAAVKLAAQPAVVLLR